MTGDLLEHRAEMTEESPTALAVLHAAVTHPLVTEVTAAGPHVARTVTQLADFEA